MVIIYLVQNRAPWRQFIVSVGRALKLTIDGAACPERRWRSMRLHQFPLRLLLATIL